MKQLLLSFIGIFACVVLLAQTPQALKYQAVARNLAGDPITNQLIAVKISILSGNPSTGLVVYSELHDPLTNNFGLFSIEIGNPLLVLSGIFEAIPWGINNYFMKVEMDPLGGTNYQLMGTSQLLAVPYALYSENTAHPEDADADPGNEIQTLSIAGTDLTLSDGGGTIPLPNGLWNENGPNIYYNTGAVGIGTPAIDPYARLHIALPSSGNFARLRIESPDDNYGFGILFAQPAQDWYIGQNIGNWNDGRFQIVPDGSSNWITILSNGNVGLTKAGFTTPHARFQVPQNGNMNNGGSLDLTQAAIHIGYDMNKGISFDNDQMESINNTLRINSLSPSDVLLAYGGGNVGINVDSAHADFHVGEGKTVLFGADTLGKTNYYPDAKMMFLPGKGGAFRVGQLNADGSIIGGTGYNFWDPSNVGWASIAIGNNTKATGAGSVALGIRAAALNFGAVALGHLSRTKGNSGVAAGYYTRADAFVSTAVGAGNVGGGNSNSWNNLDPIFEVGNSIDTTNRSNAFTVLKNGRVAINHHNPQSMLDIEQPNPGPGNGVLLNLASIGHWETNVDNAADYNFYFNNILKGYILDTDGTYIKTSDQSLKSNVQPLGAVLEKVLQLKPTTYQFRDTPAGSPVSTGFIAQEVEPFFPNQVSEKDGIKGLRYSEFGVLAIKAIQEQQELIEAQQEQIQSLENRLKVIEQRLTN